MRVVGYIRVSTEEQGDSRAGLEAQRSAIEVETGRRCWDLVSIEQDIASGKTTVKRPGLAAALAAVQTGAADGLIVAKLDRLSRSLLDFAGILEQSRRQRWQFVALDLGVDTETA
jgi:DNA invertase Pin-like site-specific DNA recombinase